MKASLLPDRGVVGFAGEGAHAFLNGLLTTDVTTLAAGEWRYCALLTPQGKLIVDAFVTALPPGQGEGCRFDVPASQQQAFLARMKLYDLRARYALEDLSGRLAVMAVWDGTAAALDHPNGADPRLAALGQRVMLPPDEAPAVAAAIGADLVAPEAYEAHRIALGVPRGDVDFAYGDAFPHEADIDQLHGIDFRKGCFVGQEVVQRMERRHGARTRVVPVAIAGAPPRQGAAVTADGRPLGTIGSTSGGRGLALLRLDRVEEALSKGHVLQAEGATLRLVRPDWIRFDLPHG